LCNADTPLEPHEDLRLIADFEATGDWILEPGDILYVPPGIAHDGVAVGDDCMTYSIGFRAPSRAELVENWCAHQVDAMVEDDRYADPDLKVQACPGEITASALDRLHAMVLDALSDRRLLRAGSEPTTVSPSTLMSTGAARSRSGRRLSAIFCPKAWGSAAIPPVVFPSSGSRMAAPCCSSTARAMTVAARPSRLPKSFARARRSRSTRHWRLCPTRSQRSQHSSIRAALLSTTRRERC
jgi:hypothetical protein